MARRTATMWQVAERAGVSQATVSLVLNNAPGNRVTEATRARVMEAVEALGYRTNAFAKSLRSGQSGIIGFVSDEVASAPFAGRLLQGAQKQAWESGHVILSVDTFGETALESSAIDMMLSYRVLGVIFASMYHRVVEVPQALHDVPTVVANAQAAGDRFSSVFPDEERGGHVATRQRTEAGHERIAYIDIQPLESDLPAGVGRRAGYRRALEEAGLPVDPRLVRYGGDGTVEDGLALTAELLDEPDPPTAIFCGNDRTAWGAYRTLEARGLRVPDDCSIVGFDDQETLAAYLDPGLSTMALPYERMARRAVSLLLADPREDPRSHPIECSPVLRGSVASAKVRA